MTVLVPEPHILADLLVRMIEEPWPTTAQDRQRYFDPVRLHAGEVEPLDRRDPDKQWRKVTTDLTGPIEGSCATYLDEFLGVYLFGYSEREPNCEVARQAYVDLSHLLSENFGEPAEEWGTPDQPASMWQAGPLTVDLYCFQEHSSGIMAGVSHTQRSTANDTAVRRRHELEPDPRWMPDPGATAKRRTE